MSHKVMPGKIALSPKVLENVVCDMDMTPEKDSITAKPPRARRANLFT
jgi:hypothetical protein